MVSFWISYILPLLEDAPKVEDVKEPETNEETSWEQLWQEHWASVCTEEYNKFVAKHLDSGGIETANKEKDDEEKSKDGDDNLSG